MDSRRLGAERPVVSSVRSGLDIAVGARTELEVDRVLPREFRAVLTEGVALILPSPPQLAVLMGWVFLVPGPAIARATFAAVTPHLRQSLRRHALDRRGDPHE